MRYKAQAGMEYMLVFGFSLVILAILWSYSSSNVENTKWDFQISYAKTSLDKIVKVSDVAYVQGPPSQFYIYPAFPDNINEIYIESNTISMELVWKGGVLRNITAVSIANLTGNLSTASGTRKILVKSFQSWVEISESS